MSSKSSIEWTDATLNVVVGCQQVSPGCDNCYAKYLVDVRQSKNPKSARFGKPFEQLTFHPERWKMLRTKKPTMFFVNSMSDMFHRDIPTADIAHAWDEFARHPWHTFQVLTKRPERMRRVLREIAPMPLQNVWLGVSIESGAYAWRADMLRETPAAIRFISAEPLLAPLHGVFFDAIDWVIVGGESGHGWRPMDFEAARQIRDVCRRVGAAYFMKQAAAYHPTDDMIPADLRIREYPKTRATA